MPNELKPYLNASFLKFLPKETLHVWALGAFKIPMVLFVSPKVLHVDDHALILKVSGHKRNLNHLNSLYFGVLAVGADLVCGLYPFIEMKKRKLNLSLAFKNFNAEFHQLALGDTFFYCETAPIRELIDNVMASKERVTKDIHAFAYTKQGGESPVASFTLGLSLKEKK